MKGTLIFLTILMLMFLACARNDTEMTSTNVKPDNGFIKIYGQIESIQVYINDVEQKLVINDPDKRLISPQKTAVIEIPSGTYKIEIKRGGASILKQKIVVNIANTTEVKVP